MPLAIELAAAWVRTLTCQEIADEIEQDLDLLKTEMQDVPLRQRSIRAVFEHSWNELSGSEQAAFAKLSVFRGGFEREAAQKVTEATIRILSELINKSLLTRDSSGRFQVHELLRQYAAEKLDDDEETSRVSQERHAAYFTAILKGLEEAFIRGARVKLLDKINLDLDNVLLAWSWAIEHKKLGLLEDGMRSLFWFYEAKAWYSEGEETFRAAADSIPVRLGTGKQGKEPLQTIMINLQVRQAWFASRMSRYKDTLTISGMKTQQTADLLLEEGDLEGHWVAAGVTVNTLYGLSEYASANRYLKGVDDRLEQDHNYSHTWPWAKGQNLANLGRIAGALGDYEKARRLLREGVTILRPLGDHVGIMLYIHTLGGIVQKMGHSRQARALFQEGLQLADAHSYLMGKVLALGDLGNLAYAEGEYGLAREHFESSLALSEEIGDSRGRALALTNLGRIATALAEYDEARLLFEQGLNITERTGNRRGTALTLIRLSDVQRLMGDLEQAEALCLESWQICQKLGYRKGSVLALIAHGEIALAREAFPVARNYFQKSLVASEILGFVSGTMRSLIGLGRAALGMGELKEAEKQLRRGLAEGGESTHMREELGAALTLAETLVAAGDYKGGGVLLAFVVGHPAVNAITKNKATTELDTLADKLNQDDFEAVVARGRKLNLDDIRGN